MSAWFGNYGFAEVFPDLLVGAYPLDADDVARLADGGVRRVLNLAQDAEYPAGSRAFVAEALARHALGERRVELTDFGRLPPARLDEAVETLLGWMRDDVRAYVHCRAGWQRSAAVATGAVAVYTGVEIETALAYVRRRKPSVEPLPHQLADLAAWFRWRTQAGPGG